MQHNYEAHGGVYGNLLRRLIHVASIIIPLLYYHYDQIFAPLAKILTVHQLIIIILIITMIIESLRLQHAWLVVGQRNYENQHISGFTWSLSCSLFVVLTISSPALALAIIASYALGDPLIGELRRYKVATWLVILTGLVLIGLIWFGCLSYFGLSAWWLVFIMPIVTVAAEWPQLVWIDDNALMQLIPWALIQVLVLLKLVH